MSGCPALVVLRVGLGFAAWGIRWRAASKRREEATSDRRPGSQDKRPKTQVENRNLGHPNPRKGARLPPAAGKRRGTGGRKRHLLRGKGEVGENLGRGLFRHD